MVPELAFPHILGADAVGEIAELGEGASGSGSMQIQVAKALGAQVATTVRDDTKGEFAKKVGADVVIDNLAGDVLAKSIETAKLMGVIVAFGFAAGTEVKFDIRSLFFAQKKLRGSMASDAEDLQLGLELISKGKVKPTLDRALPLSQAAEAHRLVSTNQAKGNIMLLPWAE